MIDALRVLLIIVLLITIVIVSNPLIRSPAHIKKNILKLTPIGMSMEDVVTVIEAQEKWEVYYISNDHGYHRPGTSDPEDIALGRETIIGEKSIRVLVGEFRIIFTTSVTVFWGFDENSELIDIYVWMDVDSW